MIDQIEKSEHPRCTFFVLRKKRNCRMFVKPGKSFCGEHTLIQSNLEQKEEQNKEVSENRIACPNDSKHTCNANRLEKHLRVCPSKPKPVPDYCIKGINSIPQSDIKAFEINPISIHSVDDEHLIRIVEGINKVYTEQHFGEKIQTDILKHDLVEDYIKENPSFGPAALKHLEQNSSLLANLEKEVICENDDDNIAYVEFGSGRGQLTYWLARSSKSALEQKKDAQEKSNNDIVNDRKFILIDKASHRHKFDNKLKDETPDFNVTRVRVDIQDLVLEKLPVLKDQSVIAISKHLCGAATDLALNALVNFSSGQKSKFAKEKLSLNQKLESNTENNLIGIMFALCCHHRCSWRSFVGKKYILQTAGFLASEFPLLCGITSWATCGSGKPRNKGGDGQTANLSEKFDRTLMPSEDLKRHLDFSPEDTISRYDKLELNQMQREEIGRRCKRILDEARCQFLRENLGFRNIKLKYYVDTSISVENVILIATK